MARILPQVKEKSQCQNSSCLLDHAEPLRIPIKAQPQLEKESDLLIDQIRSIDNKCLIKGPLLTCAPSIMKRIYEAVSEVIGLKIT